MQPKYSHLTTSELISNHRYDVQGDELMDEIWRRLELFEAQDRDTRVKSRYVEEQAA